jgi:hypothetical protein
MNAKIFITKNFILCILLVLTSACTFRPNIISAHAHRVGDNELIVLELDSRAASIIKSSQIYFSAIVFDCGGSSDGYPATPYIAGERASGFKFSVTGPIVNITGAVPVSIFDRYHPPCVFIRGGSYFLRKMKSVPIPIINTDVEGCSDQLNLERTAGQTGPLECCG